MPNKREVKLISQPALVPLFGGMDKRPRALDRDVITVGRARGCDIGLDSPEISTLHCILYHCPEGIKVRDCGSRTGTRVNGNFPKHNALADGDVLQVGPFCFKVIIPLVVQAAAVKLDVNVFEHNRRARERLIQLALRLRTRLRRKGAEVEAGLQKKANELRDRIRHYDQRFNQLESAERDLEGDREKLQREREAHLTHMQKVEEDLGNRLEAAEQEIKTRWQEFQQRCQKDEAHNIEQAKQIKQHRQELEQKSANLQRDRVAFAEQQKQQVGENNDKSENEAEETMKLKEQWAVQQAELNAILEKQRFALDQAETALLEQRTELAHILNELREIKVTPQAAPESDSRGLAQENEELRRMLGEYESRLAQVETPSSQPAEPCQELEGLKGENELLRRLLEEKETYLEELRNHVPAPTMNQTQIAAPVPAGNGDLESYEAELNRYRQQLEVDRAKLNKEIDQLRLRNEELDQATREMEMEMSKERAEFARERIRLDRLREEVRTELERAQRDASVRESLAPVTKLREELTQKKSTSRDDGGRLKDSLRSFKSRLSDTPT
jgi:pSer/pThr/pTyr-binding forkhead associated (FHA) protein